MILTALFDVEESVVMMILFVLFGDEFVVMIVLFVPLVVDILMMVVVISVVYAETFVYSVEL